VLGFLADSCCSPNLMPAAPSFDPWLLLGTGLTISLGHCIGMCGPLVGAVAMAQPAAGRSARRLLPGFLLYHLGRIGAYALIGLALGLVGTAADLAGQGQWLRGGLSFAVGLAMALLGLGLAGWLPARRWVESGRLAGFIVTRFRGMLGRAGAGSRLALGVANGFLPCGPVYVVALGAMAAGSPWRGAGAMLLFGAGTLPVMLALSLGIGRLSPRVQGRFNRVAAVLVIAIAVQLLLRGAAAFGWVEHLKFGEFVIY
jgi:sulfite exporter TauE/SafE